MENICFYFTKKPRIGILSFFELCFLLLIITIPISLILFIIENILISRIVKNTDKPVITFLYDRLVINYKNNKSEVLYKNIKQVRYKQATSTSLTYGGHKGYGFAQKITNHNYGTLKIISKKHKYIIKFIQSGEMAENLLNGITRFSTKLLSKNMIDVFYATPGLMFELCEIGEVNVCGYYGTQPKVFIPSMFYGKDVCFLDPEVFKENPFVKFIQLPNTLKWINMYAFFKMSSLEEINIPRNVSTIGMYAFSQCRNLQKIFIAEGLEEIGSSSFVWCDKLKNIVIPKSVNKVGRNAFQCCNNLIIYCSHEQKPKQWDEEWNISNRPVYWAGQWKYDNEGNPVPL